jgi:hypothetical protein
MYHRVFAPTPSQQSGPSPSHIANDSSRVYERKTKSEAVWRDGSSVAVAEVDTSPPRSVNAEATLESRDLLEPSSRRSARVVDGKIGVEGLHDGRTDVSHVALDCSIEVLLWRLPCVFLL